MNPHLPDYACIRMKKADRRIEAQFVIEGLGHIVSLGHGRVSRKNPTRDMYYHVTYPRTTPGGVIQSSQRKDSEF